MPVSSEQTTYRRRLIICMYVQTSRIRMRAVHTQLLHSSHIQAFQASNIQASHIYSHTYRPATYTAVLTDQPPIQPYLEASHIYSHIYRSAAHYSHFYRLAILQARHIYTQPYLRTSHLYSHIYWQATYTAIFTGQPYSQARHIYSHIYRPAIDHAIHRCCWPAIQKTDARRRSSPRSQAVHVRSIA